LTAPADAFEDLCLYFTVVVDKKKAVEMELKPEGKEIQVTAENVKEYLELTAQALLTKRYSDIVEAFRKGFDSVIDLEIVKKWIRPNEFWCLTSGTKELTAELVLGYTVFQGSNIENISGWFRRYLSESTR
jgi:E3 ubiquitin-protein ligase NEDD4